ncbi:hypothetical protein EBR43_04370 [bacterium]|jgi:hypothetical protein|nr:hypothetical protein [bacterium]NBX72130.1 hypothetical protein [bacterium]
MIVVYMAQLNLFGMIHTLQAADGNEQELLGSIAIIEQKLQEMSAVLTNNRDRNYTLLLLKLAQDHYRLLHHKENISIDTLEFKNLYDRIELSLAKSREYI